MKWWQWLILIDVAAVLAISISWSLSKGWQKAEERHGAKQAPVAQAEALLD